MNLEPRQPRGKQSARSLATFTKRPDIEKIKLKRGFVFLPEGMFFAETEKEFQIRDGFGKDRSYPKRIVTEVVLK